VGALRGPLIHDAMFRTLQSRGVEVRFRFGVDDYDPVDEIPYGEREHYERYLGAPLCNTPAPPGSPATDMAEHYIAEFFGVFADLGIKPEFYRMRDIYRAGGFNEAIDAILRQAPVVRRIYKEVSGSDRAENWHPFQTVCEKCGRVGTTEVVAYDGREVEYHCRPNLVKWATGCGHHGKVSPFDGRGKLPWKLEWCAKWRTFPVTIEGAGQDHCTKGGSRDVAAACLRAIFGQKPPLNIPYSFFLVGGAKMSSSKGVGVTSREMADFLPPEILRFLLIRPTPQVPVNFEPTENYILTLFSEYDRFHQRFHHDPKFAPDARRVYELSRVGAEEPGHLLADFQLVATMIQMPHLDLETELVKRKGAPLTELEQAKLRYRVRAARYWLEHFATEEEKTKLQETLPARAAALSETQRAFLRLLAHKLPETSWTDEAVQKQIFDVARLTPIDQPSAFKAIYCVLLDRDSGPKAGNLLSFLDPAFVIRRCGEVTVDSLKFWSETSVEPGAFEEWLNQEKPKIVRLAATPRAQADDREAAASSGATGMGVVEFLATLADGKTHCRRVVLERPGTDPAAVVESASFAERARSWIAQLGERTGVPVVVEA